MSSAERKRELRARARRIPSEPAAARAALERLVALEVWEGVRAVALYAAHGHEPPTDALARVLVERGVEVAWPRVEGGRIALRACPPAELVPGHRGIPEPASGAPAVEPVRVDVFVVPGLLFDRRGARLGRGMGHYDRLLSGGRSDSLRIGLTCAARLVDALPVDAWDVSMHRVVTEREVISESPVRKSPEGDDPCP